METQVAEIASVLDGGKVDSDPATATTDGSAPSGTETAAAKDPVSPEKKRDEVNERFDKLTRDLYELRSERDRDRYELTSRDQKIAQLEAQLADTAKQRQIAPDTLPTLESVGFDETKYTAAIAEHFSRIAEQKGEAAAQKALDKYIQQQQATTTVSTWQKREAEFVKTNPDYVEKVQKAATLPISQEMQQRLMQLEDGPQIALHLVENREKALEIMRLPPDLQLMEVGRIRGAIEAKKLAPKPPVSGAPPPAGKIEATEAATHVKVDSADSDTLSDAEWTRRRNAQEQARLRKIRNG